MSREWTPAQKDAIDVRKGPVVVSAAAGSGKTAVMIERTIKLITDKKNPVSVDKILIVTFTREAASQLRDRLYEALNELIKKNPKDNYLLRQKSLLPKANISTIDSFCSAVVKEYFYELNIDRNMRIVDDSELETIKADAMKLTLDSLYTEGSDSFFELVDAFASERDDRMLSSSIMKIHNFLLSHPFPKKWMEEKLRMYFEYSDIESSFWGKIIFDYAKNALSFLLELAYSSIEIVKSDGLIKDKLLPFFEKDRAFAEELNDAIKIGKWDETREVLFSFFAGRFPTVSKQKDNVNKVKAHKNREIFKEIIEDLQSLFSETEEEFFEDIKELKKITEEIFRCVMLFQENFSLLKVSKKVADYSDLEHWALKLFVDEETQAPTDIAKEYRNRFDAIMIDEYQDANEVQDTIFTSISKNEENIFVVGDVKQSIYGFRQAMPEIFISKKDRAKIYDSENENFPAKIILDKNFRSAEGITNAVNFFFRNLMSRDIGDIDYNDEEKLVYGASLDDVESPAVEIDFVDLEALKEDDKAKTEAKCIAEKILSMRKAKYKVKDGDTFRPVEFGDFAILMRSKTVAQIYVDTLAECMIPSYSDNDTEFISTKEIMIATNLLRVIDNPMLDIELLSVLYSPIYGFTSDDLARIRTGNRKMSLYNALCVDAREGNSKSQSFLDELSYFRFVSTTLSLSKLINVIYEKTGMLSIFSATDNTDVKKNNLLLLMSYAKDFEHNTKKGLSSFISYLDKIKESEKQVKGAVDLSHASHNAVRIMSIHKSKGLEFPIVFIANTTRQFVSDTKDNVLLDSKCGIALKRKDLDTGAVYDTVPRKALSLEIKRNKMSEELRVFYVGMTRAKQKLILMSTHDKLANFLTKTAPKVMLSENIPPYVIKNASTISDWIGMCALLHKDGTAVRTLSNAVLKVKESECDMDINIIKECGFCNSDSDEDKSKSADETDENNQSNSKDEKSKSENSLSEILKVRKEYRYPYAGMLNLPHKVSASELSHKMSDKSFDRILSTPAFMSDKKLTGAQKGTALHAFMQFADFDRAKENIEGELSRLTDKGYLTKVQAESIEVEKASAFINSDIIDRVLKSEEVYREYRFSTYIDAQKVISDIDEKFKDETVILQGAVDLAFVENGEIVIVDYKTDRVKDADKLLDMYSTQLKLYKDAMEKCTEYKVKECLIYSLYLNTEIKVC